MSKILIIGSEGMLGQALVKTFQKDKEYEVSAWDKSEIDITSKKEVDTKIGKLKPNFILNAAAYNAVDKCEDAKEFKLAKKLNGEGPGNLAKVAKKIKAVLVQYSTDYVFDGQPDVNLEPAGCSHSCGSCQLHESFKPEIGFTPTPKSKINKFRTSPQPDFLVWGFKEDAKTNPISNYGKSKLLGEKEVQKEKGKYYIIRLSKLFGSGGKSDGAKRSFFDVMLEAGRKNKSVNVIDEETSCFTYAPDLAKKTKEIIEAQKPFGAYHVTNADPCTWYEAVVELYKQAGLKTKVVPIGADEYPRPAKRPFISTLLNTKLNPMRSYKDALKEYLTTMRIR